MKGIVHFLSGLAAATFFPEAVHLAASQSSFLLVLGGIGGLLPDTLDFRFSRFIEKADVDVDPHPDTFDASAIAARVAQTIDQVAETGHTQILQLRTMRLGADLWQQYTLRFDVPGQAVLVTLGPVVNTSQMPLPETRPRVIRPRPDTAPPARSMRAEKENSDDSASLLHFPIEQALLPDSCRHGRAAVRANLRPTYGQETVIDIFGGPSFALERRDGQVEISFLPWHRQWSHSFTLAALVGLLVGLPFGLTAGILIALGIVVHSAEDQLGFLGSNLLPPFSRRRSPGLKLFHSGEAAPNFFAVWTALLLILFNLDRYSAHPTIDPLKYFGLAWLPALLLLLVAAYRRRARKTPPESLPASQQADLLEEAREVVDT